jgi:predicted GNAT family N-acyltransferase
MDPVKPTIKARQITVAEALPLRHAVLRPGRPIATAHFPGDDHPMTKHFGMFDRGSLVCVGSLVLAEMAESPGKKAFQIRGMATAPDARNRGFGRAIVKACVELARQEKADLLWCNARVSATEFYRKMGFEVVGNEFDIPDVGPHFRMRLWLAPPHPGLRK